MEKELCKLFNVSELMRLTVEGIDNIDEELKKDNLSYEYKKELEWDKKILQETRELYHSLEQRGKKE